MFTLRRMVKRTSRRRWGPVWLTVAIATVPVSSWPTPFHERTVRAAPLATSATATTRAVDAQPGRSSTSPASRRPAATTRAASTTQGADEVFNVDPTVDERLQRIRTLETYYAKTYSQPLGDKNRLAQLIAVLSLARIDGPPVTARLLEALSTKDPLVGQLAWEALHARYGSLDESQRLAWVLGGLELVKRGAFPGETVAPLLEAAATQPLSKLRNLPDAILSSAVETNDPATPGGTRALQAVGRAIAAWGERRFTQGYPSRMAGKPALVPRLAVVLGAIPGAPQPKEGDATAARAAWARFARDLKLASPTTRPTYAPAQTLLAAPKRIEDPEDAQWRRELELQELDLDAVELVFCIDGTGSMADTNPFVTAYVGTIARLLHVMSDKVKVGTIYYRHEIDPAIMLDCCRTVGDRPRDYPTRILGLTPDAIALAQQMQAQKPPSKNERYVGHNRLGAYTSAITTAMHGLQWASKGMKIIACTGDAAATTGSAEALVQAARAAKENGFSLMFLVETATAARETGPASRAATGLEPLVYKNDITKAKASDFQSGDAVARFKGSAFETMTLRVLESTLPVDYRDRVKPLMEAALPILAAQDAATEAAAALDRR